MLDFGELNLICSRRIPYTVYSLLEVSGFQNYAMHTFGPCHAVQGFRVFYSFSVLFVWFQTVFKSFQKVFEIYIAKKVRRITLYRARYNFPTINTEKSSILAPEYFRRGYTKTSTLIYSQHFYHRL